MKKTASLLVFFLLMALSGTLVAQNASMAAQIRVSIAEAAPYTIGQTLTLSIHVEPKKGWHVYSAIPSESGAYMPASVVYDLESRGFRADSLLSEKGPRIDQMDEMMGGMVRYYEREVTYTQKITLTEAEVVVAGTFDFMACDEMKCLPLSEGFSLKLKTEE